MKIIVIIIITYYCCCCYDYLMGWAVLRRQHHGLGELGGAQLGSELAAGWPRRGRSAMEADGPDWSQPRFHVIPCDRLARPGAPAGWLTGREPESRRQDWQQIGPLEQR